LFLPLLVGKIDRQYPELHPIVYKWMLYFLRPSFKVVKEGRISQ